MNAAVWSAFLIAAGVALALGLGWDVAGYVNVGAGVFLAALLVRDLIRE